MSRVCFELTSTTKLDDVSQILYLLVGQGIICAIILCSIYYLLYISLCTTIFIFSFFFRCSLLILLIPIYTSRLMWQD
jgi:hypothetical protein